MFIFDFLGLKTLTVIQEAVNLVKKGHGHDIDILKIPFDDHKTFEMLSRGETTGVFQLESAGMKDVLRKMKPNRFEDIIALVALYRPGPMDNIPKYIAVKAGDEEPDYLHPKLQPMLEETFGIMIYQEQFIQMFNLLGLNFGQGDILRKLAESMDHKKCNEYLEENLFALMDTSKHHIPRPSKATNGHARPPLQVKEKL